MSKSTANPAEALLRERARQLASRRHQRDQRRVYREVVTVRRRRTRLALPTAQLREVRPVKVSKVPGAADHVQGLFQVRGECFCLYDLPELVGSSATLEHRATTMAVLVECARHTVALRINEIIGPRTVYADELAEHDGERRLAFVDAVTRDVLNVVNVQSLLTYLEVG